MKRAIYTIAIIGALIAIVWALNFYSKNLKGIKPAIGTPKEDITMTLNTTGMPLSLPEGFSISIFAKDLGNPRVLLEDETGTLLVSLPKDGRVVALRDNDKDGISDETIPVAEGLNRPHGLEMKCRKTCTLYIAESHQVASYEYNPQTFRLKRGEKIVDLPDGGNHWTRTIFFMPPPQDHILLVSIGSSCNVCTEQDPRRASILAVDTEKNTVEPFATGLRNAVFLTSHPLTKKIWATEMGRDLLGDDVPPDEINIVERGGNYGWPNCYGRNTLDIDFHKDDHVHIRPDCSKPFELPSHINIQAHSAPLGLAFIPHKGWPREYKDDLLVSFHGSWNRTIPTGYKLVRYKLDPKGNYKPIDPKGSAPVEDFISGWLRPDQTSIGRPVDILINDTGVMYLSDDKAGVIYRVIYKDP